MRIHNGHPGLRMDRRAVSAVIHALDARAGEILARGRGAALPAPPAGTLSLAFLTAAALARLHGRFLDDPSATDVITFAGDPQFGQAGEICVSAAAARAYARRHRRDFSTELTLYLVHGWLHLAGHEDLERAAKRRMRAAETRALAVLRSAGRIPKFALDD